MQKEDKLIIGGHEFHSRFILGSGKYSLKLIEAAVKDAGAASIMCEASPKVSNYGLSSKDFIDIKV